MDTSEWLKSVLVVGHEDGGAMDYSSTSGGLMASSSRLPAIAETRLRTPTPQNEQAALKCPRCESTRTKFCYYNNYSLSQPRYFCKTCRRYWTKGGSLRNVPVGGGCRKNSKRPHPVVKKADEPLGRAPALVMGSGATDLQRHRPSFGAPIGLDTEDTTSMMQRSTRSLYFMGNDGIIGFQAASRLGITSATNTLGLVVFPMEECRDEKAAAEVKHGEGNPSFGWRDPSCSPNVVRDQHGEGNPSFGWRDPSCSPNVVRDQPMGCSDGHRRADKFFY